MAEVTAPEKVNDVLSPPCSDTENLSENLQS